VARICRYPVKGLSAQDLERVEVAAGGALPHDRRFAIARASTPIDTANPGWLPKQKFHVLMRDEKLAQLGADYDPETTKLTLRRKGRPVSTGRLNDPTGRTTLSQFFAAFLGEEAKGTPKVVDAGAGTLSDQRDPVVSLLNLASVADLQRVTGRPVDPIRFRANLHLEGLDAWAEWDWIGRELTVGGVRLRAVEAIERCAATEVNPDTAERDLNLPKILQRGYGHVCMGLYCEVLDGGEVAVGDAVAPAG
jgi:uncharacterized protein YcbX